MTTTPPPARLAAVQLVVFDVDGVLTDGRLLYGEDGVSAHSFNVRDGFAVVRAAQAGLTLAVISGRKSPSVARRLRELRIPHVYQAVRDKAPLLLELCNTLAIAPAAAAFCGDDLNDIPAMRAVGLATCVKDAEPGVVDAVTAMGGWVLDHRGGHGAARQLLEAILTAQGHWAPEGA